MSSSQQQKQQYTSSPFIVEPAGSSDLSSIESAQDRLRSLAHEPTIYTQVPSFYQRQSSPQQQQQPRTSFLGPPKEEQPQQQTQVQWSEFNRVATSILQSKRPVDITESETATFAGETGIWANKADLSSWQSSIPLSQYPINDDPQPQIIRKSSEQQVTYTQQFAIKYLRPPSPPPAGELIIEEEPPVQMPPAPDLVIRQEAPRPKTPEPLVFREAPPRPPQPLGPKIVRVPGKRMPPPPRRVIIERLPPLPPKPPAIIIERWLAFNEPKRNVVYKPAPEPVYPEKPRNIIIQWETPQTRIVNEVRDLGVFRVNPDEYLKSFGELVTRTSELPEFARELVPPKGIVMATERSFEHRSYVPELTGDLDALQMIDLDREGLSEYKHLQRRHEPREFTTQFKQSEFSKPALTQVHETRQVEVVKLTPLVPAQQIDQSSRGEESQRHEKREATETQEGRKTEQATQAGSGLAEAPERQSERPKEQEAPQKEQQAQPTLTQPSGQDRKPEESKTPAREGQTTIPNLPSEWGIGEQISHIQAQMNLGQSLKPVEATQEAQRPEEQKSETQRPETRRPEEKQQHQTLSKGSIVNQVFSTASRNDDNTLSESEAKRLLKNLNERLNRRSDEEKCQRFLDEIKRTPDGNLDFESFKSAVIKVIYT